FRAALIEGSDRPIDFIREWSGGDRSRYFDSDGERVAFLRGKYRRFAIDLIVSMDETGFDFMRRHRADLWPAAPLVFCGISDADVGGRRGPARSAGIALADDVAGTIELALALQPAARRLVVVDGTADPESGIGVRVREALVKARRRLDVGFLAAEPVP